jgi:site-specific DNA-methyltransferase (adenine-specific)
MNQVLCGDVLLKLKEIPDETISCVMTSPPYWAQRDYKVTGQYGLESVIDEYLAKMWAVMDELWRVLRKDGCVFWNMGDKYGGTNTEVEYKQKAKGKTSILTSVDHLCAEGHTRGKYDKSLLFIPERFAIGCIERGWIIRNKIIWHKPNPMPCSCKDRFSNTWEHLFFMTKSRKYWFDMDAVRRPSKWGNLCWSRKGSPEDSPYYSENNPRKRWGRTKKA